MKIPSIASRIKKGDSTGKPWVSQGHLVIIASFFAMVLTMGVYFTFGIFIKSINAELGWSRSTISGAFSVAWIVNGILSILAGAINDRFGPRLVITVSGLLSGTGYLLISRISSEWQLYLFFGLIVGAGSSIFIPLTSTIARWYLKNRSAMTGIAISGIGIGSFIMPPIANSLILHYTWRTAFSILGIALLVVVVIAAQFLKKEPTRKIGSTQLNNVETINNDQETRSKKKVFKEVITTSQFWLFFSMLVCLGFVFFAIQIHLPPYATDKGISPNSAANILAVMGGAGIIGRIVFGNLGDNMGNRKTFMLGFAFMSVAMYWLLTAENTWSLYIFAIVFGISYGNCVTQESPLVATIFGLKSHGLVFGLISTGFSLGSAIGPYVAGQIFDLTGSYDYAFMASAGIITLGLVLNILLPKQR
ncbi:MAG: MFS transporter [Dehalococcoidia bacterium]|nr:MFS transporter [Dehalococcoidia bacterium]